MVYFSCLLCKLENVSFTSEFVQNFNERINNVLLPPAGWVTVPFSGRVKLARLSPCLSVTVSVDPVCVHFSFNLPPQTETGVATPPKKPWPPLGGDRRVSGPVPVCSQSIRIPAAP